MTYRTSSLAEQFLRKQMTFSGSECVFGLLMRPNCNFDHRSAPSKQIPGMSGARNPKVGSTATRGKGQRTEGIFSYIVETKCRSYCIGPPGSDSFRSGLVLLQMFIYFDREISEIRRPIGAKFCTMITPRPRFITPVQNFGGPNATNFRGQKHAKFGSISVDFKVRRRIYPERIKIFKIRQKRDLPRFLPRSAKEVRWTLVQKFRRSRSVIIPTEVDFFGRPYFGP